MEQYLQYIFWVLAAFFNAVMDSLENAPNYNESIFRSLPKQFWLKEESWKYAKKILGYRCDAWHFAKSLMIICLAATVIFYNPILRPWLNFVAFGLIWNISFTLFYHEIFGVK